jgi:hypothetical protein
MLCADCQTVSVPETVLEGSDRTELLSWICLGLPGWLYCSWRHVLRQKVCAQCGSGAVIREATRSRRVEAGPPRWTRGRITEPRRWPRALATPRERLLHGGVDCTARDERGRALSVEWL